MAETAADLKKTPLNEAEKELGGKMVDFGGWELPVQYSGILEITPKTQAVMTGGDTPTEYGDHYFFTNPRLETGDERYAWVNQTMFIGQGRILSGPAVEYRVYRIAHS